MVTRAQKLKTAMRVLREMTRWVESRTQERMPVLDGVEEVSVAVEEVVEEGSVVVVMVSRVRLAEVRTELSWIGGIVGLCSVMYACDGSLLPGWLSSLVDAQITIQTWIKVYFVREGIIDILKVPSTMRKGKYEKYVLPVCNLYIFHGLRGVGQFWAASEFHHNGETDRKDGMQGLQVTVQSDRSLQSINVQMRCQMYRCRCWL